MTVPILLYHHISDAIFTEYNVQPAVLDKQMEWLFKRGYSTVTISDVSSAIRDGTGLPDRPIVITFDDGYLDVYLNAYPILEKYDFVGTFFVIGDTVDTRGNLSTAQLQELVNSGWEIGSHSQHHTDLTGGYNWDEEINYSKQYLEGKLYQTVQTFAYPYGRVTDSVIDYTITAGYTSAVGLGSVITHDASSLFFLPRKEIKSWYTLDFFEGFLPWTN